MFFGSRNLWNGPVKIGWLCDGGISIWWWILYNKTDYQILTKQGIYADFSLYKYWTESTFVLGNSDLFSSTYFYRQNSLAVWSVLSKSTHRQGCSIATDRIFDKLNKATDVCDNGGTMHAIPERLTGVFMTRCYTNTRLPFTLPLVSRGFCQILPALNSINSNLLIADTQSQFIEDYTVFNIMHLKKCSDREYAYNRSVQLKQFN